MTATDILVRHGYAPTAAYNGYHSDIVSNDVIGSMLSNMAYYGYAPNNDLLYKLRTSTRNAVECWWGAVEPALKRITGDDLPMEEYVVYKNFPDEVLDKSDAEYWISQILMYLGVPNVFAERPVDRTDISEKLTLTVLSEQRTDTLPSILDSLLASPVRWTKTDIAEVQYLIGDACLTADISKVTFKENLGTVAHILMEEGISVSAQNATDVLRMAVGLSEGDVSLRTNTPLRRYTRSERRRLLGMLEGADNLWEDVQRNPERFKRFFRALRPGDYSKRFPRVVGAYDKLYRGIDEPKSFNSRLESALATGHDDGLDLLRSRPGEFVRRLRVAIGVYGHDAFTTFASVVDKLTTLQLLKLKRQFMSINTRSHRVFPPKGNWSKVQIVPNDVSVHEETRKLVVDLCAIEIGKRMRSVFPNGVILDSSTSNIRIKDNDSDLTTYGRGTAFDIPEDVDFIRTSSFWKVGSGRTVWYDNGWSFFDSEFNGIGTCSWTETRLGTAAIFSGDPVSGMTGGFGTQLIDLYPSKLAEMGVRYAVWSILCFSSKTFNEAESVFATLQWGEDAQSGELIEPARCQMAFPVTGDSLTKYIAYLDIKERKVVYMDANLPASVHAANVGTLETQMPAYVEYLDTIPSIHDLFEGVASGVGINGVPHVLTSDEGIRLDPNIPHYVFGKNNPDNTIVDINIEDLLNRTG